MGQMLPSAIPACQRWREVSTNINKKYERNSKPYLRFVGFFCGIVFTIQVSFSYLYSYMYLLVGFAGSTSQHWRSKQYTAAASAQKYYHLVLNILTE
jgi:hypothetical protein